MNKKYPVLFFSTADWETSYRTNKHYVAEDLAIQNFEIIYFESFGIRKPKMFNAIDKSRIIKRVKNLFKIRKIKKNIKVVSIFLLPFWRFYLIKKINFFILNIYLRFILKNKDFNIWTYHPYLPVNLVKKSQKSVYHVVDDLGSVTGIHSKNFYTQQSKIEKHFSLISVTSKNLIKKFKNKNKFYYPNVVDPNILKIKQLKKFTKKKIVGFFGNLTENKIDYKLMIYLAKKLPYFDFVIIGKENENEKNLNLEKLSKLKNVKMLGYLEYYNMLLVAANFDLAIIPCLKNKYTKSMFPMKYFEYISLGLRVVTTNLEFVKYIDNKFLNIAVNKNNFLKLVTNEIKKKKISLKQRKDIVKKFTYNYRNQLILQKLV